MQPSNISHSKTSFGGVLQPFIDALARTPRQRGRLIGQEILISRADVLAIIALDGEDNTHLLVSPVAGNDPRFTRLEMRGLKIIKQDWSVAGHAAQSYLDISCSTGVLPSFQRPFLRFAEDVLFEISQPDTNPVDAVYRTIVRWRRFWSADSSTEVTIEWLRGIFGELLFLEDLINRFGPSAVRSWRGPFGSDHDFQAGNDLAVEIKTSAEMPLRIHCNIRQLDSAIFRLLYVVCYQVTASEKGEAIPEIVSRIEYGMKNDESALDIFYERLFATGYRRQLESVYRETPLNHGPAAVFEVNDSFPKIIETSFVSPPDHRISDIRYILQLVGIDELALDAIADKLKYFAEAGL